MGRSQRNKGKRGESEVVDLARAAGFEDAHRAWFTPQQDGDIGAVPAYVEVRRRERLDVVAWAEEAEEKAGDKLAVVAFRRNSEPWRACIRLDKLFQLLREG